MSGSPSAFTDMKLILTVVAAITSAVCMASPLAQLMRPKGVSPTMLPDPRTTHGIESFSVATGFFGGDGCTGITAIVWAKSQSTASNLYNPFIMMNCSYETARATMEGGPTLPELGTARMDEPLVLTDGSWGETCLPETYDHPSTLDQWQYGCYAFNLISDCGVTVSVGGDEIYFPEATNVARNIRVTSADRSVIVTAESTDATVRFGIAENPLVQFIGGQSDGSTKSGTFDRELGGLIDEEYRMFVFRAAIDGGTNVVWDISAYDALAKLGESEGGVEHMDHPRAFFQEDSRIRVLAACLGGLDYDDISRWGFKLFNGWCGEEFIDAVKRADIAELQRRGIVFQTLDPDFAQVKASTRSTVDTSTVVSDDEEAKIESQTATTTYVADIEIVPGANNQHGWTTDNYRLSSSEGGVISNKVLTVEHGGVFTITAVDPLNNTFTGEVSIQSPHIQAQTKITAKGYPSGTWSKDSSDAVFSALQSATTDGRIYHQISGTVTNDYRKWHAKRLVGMPVSCWAWTGNHAKHAISPHVVASTKHYSWFSASDCTFDDGEGHRVTVSTPSSMVSLSDWAASHGFTDEEIADADVSDIVLCVTSGTIPDGCCPYFFRGTNDFARAYHGFGVLGWSATQTDLGWGVPVLVRPDTFGKYWTRPGSYPFPTETTVSLVDTPSVRGSLMPQMYSSGTVTDWMFPPTYGGDSALPVYLEHEGIMILVGSHHWVGGGTPYTKAYPILKAFVESVGDTLKTVDVSGLK